MLRQDMFKREPFLSLVQTTSRAKFGFPLFNNVRISSQNRAPSIKKKNMVTCKYVHVWTGTKNSESCSPSSSSVLYADRVQREVCFGRRAFFPYRCAEWLFQLRMLAWNDCSGPLMTTPKALWLWIVFVFLYGAIISGFKITTSSWSYFIPVRKQSRM